MSAPTRPYRMAARAEAARATAARIVEAAIEVFWEQPAGEVSLAAVAGRAGVTKQTVLRHFGSKAGLMEAAGAAADQRIRDEREAAEPGDLAGVVTALAGHYERIGDGVVRLLAERARDERLAPFVRRGWEYHVGWCERMFAPALAGLGAPVRARRLAQLAAITDVQTWRVLRRQCGLGREDTELALRELLEAIMEGAT